MTKMTQPIQIVHQNFKTKIKIIGELTQILKKYKPENPALSDLIRTYKDIILQYHEETVTHLCNYFRLTDIKEKCSIVDTYNGILSTYNFVYRIDCIFDAIKKKLGQVTLEKVDVYNTQILFKKYGEQKIIQCVPKIDFEKCPLCFKQTNIHTKSSELRCSECPYKLALKGTVFDESQFQDGANIKRGSYVPTRHCRYHLERILAIKKPNIKPKVWAKIDQWIKDNNYKYTKYLTCDDYRRCLKRIKETKHNEHIPYIRQVISRVSPMRLYYHEIKTISRYFEKAVKAFKETKKNESNLKYYPYSIAKIIEMVLNKPEDAERKQSIIDCIHFQRDATIIANDRSWEKVCKLVPEFVFCKTDKNLLFNR